MYRVQPSGGGSITEMAGTAKSCPPLVAALNYV